MAPSVPNGGAKHGSKKSIVKPVLPALPILSKASKIKAVEAQPVEAQRIAPKNSHSRLGSSGNIEVLTSEAATVDQDEHREDKSAAVSENLTEAPTIQAPEKSAAVAVISDEAGDLEASKTTEGLSHGHQPAVQADTPLDHNVSTPSNVSAPSRDDYSQQALSPQAHNGTGSQRWSDDVNDTSRPTSAGQTPDFPEAVYANGGTDTPSSHKIPYEPSDTDSNALNTGARANESFSHVNGLFSDQPQDSMLTASQRSKSGSQSLSQMPSITEHLLQLSASKVWADLTLLVHANGLPPYTAYAHSLLLMRSGRLASLMNRQAAMGYDGTPINIHPPRPILPHAFEAALRFFYSDTVLSNDSLSPTRSIPEFPSMRINILNYLLSYWMSGIELGIEPIVGRSAQLLLELIDWDIAEAVMKEAMDLDAISWRAGDQRASVTLDYAAMALELKHTVLNFLASHLVPETFNLDTTTSNSLVRSRFAQIDENRARHNPALASMVFGSMPSSADLSPSSPQSESVQTLTSLEDQAASNILLNADFQDLLFFDRHFQSLHGAAAGKVMPKIIEEREQRRLKIISNRAVPNKQRMANSEIWDLAGFRESIGPQGLQRERVGFLLPTKPH